MPYVTFDNCASDLLNVICGVPQGSILGPKLFILYINDICNTSTLLTFNLFADDTNIFCSGNDPVQLRKDIDIELVKLNVWFAVNKLSLNISKTNLLLLSNCKKKKTNIEISINNAKFETKFLCVLIDNKLNWKDHIDEGETF